MKNCLNMLKKHDIDEAKKYAKQGMKKDFAAEMEFLRAVSSQSLNSDEAMLLRVIFRNKGFYNDLSQIVLNTEQSIIDEKNWSRVQTLIEDARLDVANLAFLLYTIYSNKETLEARLVFFKADELFDLNSIEWPENIKDVCQQMAAEIAIFHSIN
jgi:hypothetical protein